MELQTSTSPTADPRAQLETVSDSKFRSSHSDVSDRNQAGDLEKAEVTPGSKADNESVSEKYPDGLVDFDGPDDPDNPKNWRPLRKWAITASMGWMTFVVTFASSIFSVAVETVSEEFQTTRIIATLGTSLFLLGFVLGPIVFGPASEAYGRHPPLFIGYAIFGIFQLPVALGRNLSTIFIGRFLGGFAACAPLAIVGGALSDIWDPIPRAYAICVFASAAFTGPVAAPIAGGFLTESSLGWRWTAWMTLILTSVFGAIGLFCIPETSAARILQVRAKHLRKSTGNQVLHSKADKNPITFSRFMTVYLIRPFVMITLEPILSLMTAYMSFNYGVLYLLFVAYPFSFRHERGWSLGVSALPFIAFIVGILAGVATMAYSTRTNFTRAYKKHGRVIPEERLPPVILNAIILPLALFWFAWTSDPNITWVPQVIASGFLGMSMLVTFWQCISYIIDCYGFYSNSAISVNTFIRSIAGAVFPLFAWDMYEALGVNWATSLLAFVCVAFVPVPILFYYYGERIRARSRFNPEAA
jgi:MFS transporter, DHA1 family, multidrug resistance protein